MVVSPPSFSHRVVRSTRSPASRAAHPSYIHPACSLALTAWLKTRARRPSNPRATAASSGARRRLVDLPRACHPRRPMGHLMARAPCRPPRISQPNFPRIFHAVHRARRATDRPRSARRARDLCGKYGMACCGESAHRFFRILVGSSRLNVQPCMRKTIGRRVLHTIFAQNEKRPLLSSRWVQFSHSMNTPDARVSFPQPTDATPG